MKINFKKVEEKLSEYNLTFLDKPLVLIAYQDYKNMKDYILISTPPYSKDNTIDGQTFFAFLSYYKKEERSLFELKNIEGKDYIIIHKDNVDEEYMTEEMSSILQLLNELSNAEKVYLLKYIIDNDIIPLSIREGNEIYSVFTNIINDELIIEL